MKESVIYQDWIAEGKREGLEEGLEQGLEQGQLTERRSLAVKMLQEGLTLVLVAKVTGFSPAQLTDIQAEPSP